MKNKTVRLIIILVLIIFVSSYYISQSGYYEYHEHEKMVLTSDKIKEFERDVRDNKEIDIKDYMDNKDISYSNKASDLVYNFSLDGSEMAKKLLRALFKKMNKLVEDD